MKDVDTQSFWESMTMGLQAQDYCQMMVNKVLLVRAIVEAEQNRPPTGGWGTSTPRL